MKKGLVDIVTDGKTAVLICTKSSLKRCGGIGDLLCGTIGAFINYKSSEEAIDGELGLVAQQPQLLAAVVACLAVREASHQAFEEKGHSLVAPDILQHLSLGLN